VATALTPATMVRDSYVTFSPTSFSTAGTVYTYTQLVDDKFYIYVEFTSTTNADFMTFTVSAGSTTVAWRRDLSTLAVTLTSTGKTAAYRALIGPLESARFMGSTGTITVTTSSSTNTSGTGFIGVAKMPYVVYS
jgi:hypothetical protein